MKRWREIDIFSPLASFWVYLNLINFSYHRIKSFDISKLIFRMYSFQLWCCNISSLHTNWSVSFAPSIAESFKLNGIIKVRTHQFLPLNLSLKNLKIIIQTWQFALKRHSSNLMFLMNFFYRKKTSLWS